LLFGEFQVLVKNIAFHYFEVGQTKLKQQLAVGCLRTRAPVHQAPRRRTEPPRPIRAWGRPSCFSPWSHDRDTRQHLADAESSPVPRAGPPSRHRGQRMRAAPLGVAMVEDPTSEASPDTPTSSSTFRRRCAKKITSSQAVVPGLMDADVVQSRTVAPFSLLGSSVVPPFLP
jgi:hypothetical protein